MRRIVVGLSGGVDSSVAAALLADDKDTQVIGVTLRTSPWRPPDDAAQRFGACCAAAGAAAARAVARQLSIPHFVLDHERAFERFVVEDFVREYETGRTPSPCVVCNRDIKFGTLLRRALAWEAEAVATGHYARRRHDPAAGRWLLLESSDRSKDQSYFLWPLSQEQLARARFPIGPLTKAEVRAEARARGLVTADAPESQELCFVEGDYRALLRLRAPSAFRPGPMVDESGRALGTHAGLGAYTVGQRRGLALPAGSAPRYVLRLDAERNTVVVGSRAALQHRRVRATNVNWIAVAGLTDPLRVEARVRHRGPRTPAWIHPVGVAEVELEFAEAQRAVAPGQSVVFYGGEVVIGGGVIAHAA